MDKLTLRDGINDYSDKVNVRKIGRTIYFFDEVSPDSVCEAIYLLQVLEAESTEEPIQMIICSGGGDCYDGFALYDKMRSSKCLISTVGSGIVASMAVILFLAGDRRYVTENARLMNHQVSTYLEGRMEDAVIDINETKALEDMLLLVISERTGRSIKKLIKERQKGDRFLSAMDSVNEGYAEAVILNKPNKKRRRKK